MKTVFKTDCGQMRDHNEDNGGVFKKGDCVLAIVADGMGGHRAGDVASALALEFIESQWKDFKPEADAESLTAWVENLINGTNQYIYEYAGKHPECKGMGTTVVAALCRVDMVIIGNVGDSRCYRLSKDGRLNQVTEDHSLVNELVKAGQLSKEDADDHPKKNVLIRALGTEPHTNIDIIKINWGTGERLLLCSDGLSNMVKEAELAGVLNDEKTLEEKSEQLITLANQAGGDDNITLTIVENDDGETQ